MTEHLGAFQLDASRLRAANGRVDEALKFLAQQNYHLSQVRGRMTIGDRPPIPVRDPRRCFSFMLSRATAWRAVSAWWFTVGL